MRPRGAGLAPAVQDVTAEDGQLILTLTPELVDKTRTSSARPNPAGIADPPS